MLLSKYSPTVTSISQAQPQLDSLTGLLHFLRSCV